MEKSVPLLYFQNYEGSNIKMCERAISLVRFLTTLHLLQYVPQIKVSDFDHADVKRDIIVTGCGDTDDNMFFVILCISIIFGGAQGTTSLIIYHSV